jgi:ABC-type branched-subunit amino acid transport system ATPase component
MNISLPTKKASPNTNPTIEFNQMVVIGANGAGKTRFGSKIEEKYLQQTHRISAQKSLSLPKESSPTSKSRAEIEFYSGAYVESWTKEQHIAKKKDYRWQNNYNTTLLYDYEKLMVLLHTEEYEESLSFKEGRIAKPTTKLDKVQNIWESVLPHRKLIKKAGVIEAYPVDKTDNIYNASELSDGERVIFYLIGEVICSPQNSIIIIDEPEMHLHKSLVKKLFDLIENERQDCAFIYLTHDVDFAFSRQNAIKIWAKSYEGNDIWDYEILDNNLPIPEQLYLEILGTRKPVVFLEGDDSSFDYKVYEQVFPDYTLKPLGSCERVINSVKAFNNQKDFHHIDSFGLIDRDRRTDEKVAELNDKNIWVLNVAEVENLFLLENIVKTIASHMGKDADDVFNQVKTNVISFFNEQLEQQIILHYKEILNKQFKSLANFTSRIISDAISEINSLFSGIDKQQLFDEIKSRFEDAVSRNDYDEILRIFNFKKALIPQSRICELTGVRNKEEYINLIVTLLKKQDAVAEILKSEIKSKIVN